MNAAEKLAGDEQPRPKSAKVAAAPKLISTPKDLIGDPGTPSNLRRGLSVDRRRTVARR
jgi:hypothetical protein